MDELVEATEVPWLEPVPDVMVDVANVDPAHVVGNRDSIRLAFVAALQHLPPRQRAVLVLRDVLRWSAKETATALETTVAAVNSALQRAHAQLAEKQLTQGTVEDDLTPDLEAMLERYVQAFWDKDVNALVTMLAQDAVWEMPPFTGWYTGAENVAALIDHRCPGGPKDMPMIRTSANGQPAFGLYMRQPDGHFEPFHLQVLQLVDGRVKHVSAFFETELFETFGLPTTLPASYSDGVTCPSPRHLARWRCWTVPSPGPHDCLQLARSSPLDVPTPCADWDLGQLLTHMEDSLIAFEEAAEHGRVARLRPARRQGPVRRPRHPARLRHARCLARPPHLGPDHHQRPRAGPRHDRRWWGLWRSPCTAGTSPGRPGRAAGCRRTSRCGCTTWRSPWSPPGERGTRFAPAVEVPPSAPTSTRLLAHLGRRED